MKIIGGLHRCVHIFDIALFTCLIPVYYHTCDLGSRSQVFGDVQNSPPRPFSCFLLARSLPINKNQRATVLQLIFAILSCLLVKAPKSFLKTCIHLLLPSTAEPGSWKCSKTSLEPILLILLFLITKTCRVLVWDLLAIVPRDWSYTGCNMDLSPRVTEAVGRGSYTMYLMLRELVTLPHCCNLWQWHMLSTKLDKSLHRTLNEWTTKTDKTWRVRMLDFELFSLFLSGMLGVL